MFLIAGLCLVIHLLLSNGVHGTAFEYGNGDDNTFKHVFNVKYNDQFHAGTVQALVNAFKSEESVVFDLRLTGCGVSSVAISGACDQIRMTHTAPEILDRSCLVHAPVKPDRMVTTFNSSCTSFDDKQRKRQPNSSDRTTSLDCMVQFVNNQANIFRLVNGSQSRAGVVYEKARSVLYDSRTDTDTESVNGMVQCAQIDAAALEPEEFLEQYWLRQRPLVIKNFHNVSVQHRELLLREDSAHRLQQVGVKLSPSRAFEGIDDLQQWAESATQYIPTEVLNQLTAPELVVVRAAHREMTLAQALGLMRHHRRANAYAGAGWEEGVFAYIEYLNMRSGRLLALLREMVALRCPRHEWFLRDTGLAVADPEPHTQSQAQAQSQSGPLRLQRGTPHFWLSNGHTEGQLHFDPFDNILLQLEGVKSFVLVGPSPADATIWLEEGHMREAEIEVVDRDARVDSDEGVPEVEDIYFQPKTRLSESTSMVHSPFHLEHSYERDSDAGELGGLGVPGVQVGTGTRRSWRDIKRRRSRLVRGLDVAPAKHKRKPTARGPDVPIITGCDVFPGDAIFVPAYYWHEVISYPFPEEEEEEKKKESDSELDTFNVAVNVWFEPLFMKEFPCSECQRSLNPVYHQAFTEHFQ